MTRIKVEVYLNCMRWDDQSCRSKMGNNPLVNKMTTTTGKIHGAQRKGGWDCTD